MESDNHQVNLQASTSTSQINHDQPSSSTQSDHNLTIITPEHVQDLSLSDSDQSSDLEILEQPPLNILKSEYIDVELLKILSEMQDLVQNKRVIDLSSAYEEQWESLQKRATDLIASVRRKCIRIKTFAVRKFLKDMELAKKSPRLLLTNEPFYSEADYMTREARMFKLLRQKMAQQQQEAKTRELELLQRQQALEELVKKQAEQLEKMMKQQQTNP
jgi:hypothetical protein